MCKSKKIKTIHFATLYLMYLENSYVKDLIFPKFIYKGNVIPNKIPETIFVEPDKLF